MLCFMPLVAAFCLLTSLSRTEDVRVSLTKTASVTAILRDLSAQTHTQLFTNDQRGREILIVDVKDVPLKDVMDRIGWATYGAWNETGEGFKLVRDLDAETKAERYYRDWQAKEAKLAIAQFRNRVLEKNLAPEMTEREAQMQGRGINATPKLIEKVMAQALGAVRPETIIYTKPDEPHVFSNQPTQVQYAFTSNMSSVMKSYNEAVGRPVKHMLLSCRYAFEEGNAKLTLFDERGDFIASSKARFRLYPSSSRPAELADEVPADMEVPLSDASKFYVRPIEGWHVWPSNAVMKDAPDVVQRLQNPDKYEPLATFATDAWRAVAKWKGRNLVANIDDVYMTPVWAAKPPKLQEAFRTAGGYNAELKPGWLIARPSLPTPPWQHRVDRAALGKLARRKIEDGVAMFKAIGDFSASQSIPPDPYQTSQYLAWAGAYQLIDLRLWPSARLFGSLTTAQQQAMIGGAAIDLSQTSSIAKEVVGSALSPGDYDELDLWSQGTVRFPSGMPQTGFLRGSVYDRSEIYILRPSTEGGVNWIGGYDYGTAHWYINNVEKNEPAMLKNLKVVLVPISGMNIEAILPPDRTQANLVNIYSMSPPYYHGPALWGDLPKWLRDKIMAAPLPPSE